MDIATSLGLIGGAIVVSTVILMGGNFAMYFSDHALIIIFGGAFSATLIRFPLIAIFHGLPLGAKFAFTMRHTTQRELVDQIARDRRGRPQGRTGRAREGRDRRSVPGQGHPLHRRRLRHQLHSRQSRARPRQLPDPSRRGPEDLPRHRGLRSGVRDDRNAARHGADVRQHDRSLQARSVHGDRAAGDPLWRGRRQSVVPAARRQAAPQAGRGGDQPHLDHRRRADDPGSQEPDAGARDAAGLSAREASSRSGAGSRCRPDRAGGRFVATRPKGARSRGHQPWRRKNRRTAEGTAGS